MARGKEHRQTRARSRSAGPHRRPGSARGAGPAASRRRHHRLQRATNAPKPPPSSQASSADLARLEAFEESYRREWDAYIELNAPQPIASRVRQFPFRHFILVACLVLSAKSVRTAVEEGPASGLELVVAALAGVYLADFLTGLIHLLMDCTPLSLRSVEDRPKLEWAAYGFILHHAWPTNWNTNDIYYAGLLRAGFLFYLPVTLVALAGFDAAVSPRTTIALLACSHSGIFTQFSHAAAHGRWRNSPFANGVIQTLQTCGVLLRPADHHLHHTNLSTNYAILTGWSNPLLNLVYRAIRPFVPESMQPETQARVFVNRANVKAPYFIIFPEWRALSEVKANAAALVD